MTSGKKKRGAGKSVADFPALREFFRILHQDFQDEYGSAAGAAKPFATTLAKPKSKRFGASGRHGARGSASVDG
jgi:hypothetical protein